jgi:transposase
MREQLLFVLQDPIQTAIQVILLRPPYSPDLNSIEKAWFKFKQLLRSAKVRTELALDQAMSEALQEISADNAQA